MPGVTPVYGFPYPTYTDPADGSSQIQALAEAVDDRVVIKQGLVSDITDKPHARVSAGAAQSIPTGTVTALTYTTEDMDNDAMANLGVNNTILTIQTAGVYLIIAQVEYAANTTGTRELAIRTGGTAIANQKTLTDTDGFAVTISTTALAKLTVGATITTTAFQNSGAALNVTTRSFQAIRVA